VKIKVTVSNQKQITYEKIFNHLISIGVLGWPKSSATLAKKLIFASVAELFGQPSKFLIAT